VLVREVENVGFQAVSTVDRRPFGIAALAPYPVFPPEFVQFLKRVVPPERHDELVWSLVVRATKPAATGGGSHAA